MRVDSRLSRTLHVLLHMARHDGPMTSDTIAAMLCTNPVVVRRMLSGLREQGYVESAKGHGGGWQLTRDLDTLTLLDIYRAVGEPALFSDLLTGDHPHCLVEQAVNAKLGTTMQEAQAALLERFRDISLGSLSQEIESREAPRRRTNAVGPRARKRANHPVEKP
ncbi:Rrf2 family transcriptional regulator [Trinickia caryophylli]|uniref:Transcriptional regulator, BadM/Rrf2 family n=1 Tax=Trinickia caryophylli TaxID=28094 RepID=A0A1X7EVF7_TRICW|nr:Rrf2 family transcriptional regulator [Trinickia caryophylli]PMS12193.1 Rrf2 family transcriptional regulator [Trinickia caryophylli]TRX18498.1 Rrf2 family transcriptional regulator [Trinickia caryophylli]WQE10713.1 Rrf2 family transcriptional regulator [Trinickia caryophylli]SMF40706.1 transcriptional regulator, BadM/Rrf2 family [Trinickia caryophylli]GLU33085.1 Rrf2 family transcriptional regulator [Trinickia caryophylli]